MVMRKLGGIGGCGVVLVLDLGGLLDVGRGHPGRDGVGVVLEVGLGGLEGGDDV